MWRGMIEIERRIASEPGEGESEAGYTLLEVLVVLGITVLLLRW